MPLVEKGYKPSKEAAAIRAKSPSPASKLISANSGPRSRKTEHENPFILQTDQTQKFGHTEKMPRPKRATRLLQPGDLELSPRQPNPSPSRNPRRRNRCRFTPELLGYNILWRISFLSIISYVYLNLHHSNSVSSSPPPLSSSPLVKVPFLTRGGRGHDLRCFLYRG